jgi:hypothetical protein
MAWSTVRIREEHKQQIQARVDNGEAKSLTNWIDDALTSALAPSTPSLHLASPVSPASSDFDERLAAAEERLTSLERLAHQNGAYS